MNAADVLGPARLGEIVWVSIEHDDAFEAGTRPPAGQYEAHVVGREDWPPRFRVTLRLVSADWIIRVSGNTDTGETALTDWWPVQPGLEDALRAARDHLASLPPVEG